jgi:hypothetical protein
MSVDQISVDQISVDQMSVDKMSVDKMSVDKMSVDKMSVDKISVDKMCVDKMFLDKMIICYKKSIHISPSNNYILLYKLLLMQHYDTIRDNAQNCEYNSKALQYQDINTGQGASQTFRILDDIILFMTNVRLG